MKAPLMLGNSAGAPLAGLRVVEFGQFIAIPAAGQILRDLGADVIKVEPAKGDAARGIAWSKDDFGPMFAPYNRGKRSVVLNLASSQGRSDALALAKSADVVMHNARPGAMHEIGLSAPALRATSPRLIVASVTGYASDSAFADRPGFDIAAQAESGMMSINGESASPPRRVGFTVVDVMAAHAVANAVLAALVRRGIHGTGATIEVALVDVAVEAMAYGWADYSMTGRLPERRGNGQPTTAPAADVIATADGAVVLSAYIDAHFSRLAVAIGCPAMAEDPRFSTNGARVAHRKELLAELGAVFAGVATVSLCERLNQAGVVVAAVRSFDQIRATPNGTSSGLFVNLQTPGTAGFSVPARPFHIDGLAEPAGELPGIGEHTEQVLQELRERQASNPDRA
jgi:crotonobetainyl-CoA:carnitine CoA-transferase CaiB-like acyl-CoA transferase